MTHDIAGVNAQAQDISFLIGYARTLSDTDLSEVAVAGYSWGGISNLFAATRDNRIDALIALDGTMRYSNGTQYIKEQADVHPEQMSIPLLFLTRQESTLEQIDASNLRESKLGIQHADNVLNAWTHGDLTVVHMLGLTHLEFASMFQRDEDAWGYFSKSQTADYGREDGMVGYQWIARYALQFLNAYLEHDAAAMAFLKRTPAENGAPKHVMTATYRPAQGVAPALEPFKAEVGRRGFDHAGDIYAAIRKESPDFKLDENAVNRWGYHLLRESHVPQATELFKLNVQMYPQSAHGYDSLGDAYEKAGEKRLAIESYRKSLEKKPDDEHAQGRLKELEGK
jgi:tetratricopeptide (TPR) repeat protein